MIKVFMTCECIAYRKEVTCKDTSVKQKSIKMYKKKTNLKISLNNLEKIE